jgi:actin-related protein 9
VGLPRSALAASSTNGSSLTPHGTFRINEYIIGQQLDDALAAGQDLVVTYPFADGTVTDWVQAEALWYVLASVVQSSSRALLIFSCA